MVEFSYAESITTAEGLIRLLLIATLRLTFRNVSNGTVSHINICYLMIIMKTLFCNIISMLCFTTYFHDIIL